MPPGIGYPPPRRGIGKVRDRLDSTAHIRRPGGMNPSLSPGLNRSMGGPPMGMTPPRASIDRPVPGSNPSQMFDSQGGGLIDSSVYGGNQNTPMPMMQPSMQQQPSLWEKLRQILGIQ